MEHHYKKVFFKSLALAIIGVLSTGAVLLFLTPLDKSSPQALKCLTLSFVGHFTASYFTYDWFFISDGLPKRPNTIGHLLITWFLGSTLTIGLFTAALFFISSVTHGLPLNGLGIPLLISAVAGSTLGVLQGIVFLPASLIYSMVSYLLEARRIDRSNIPNTR